MAAANAGVIAPAPAVYAAAPLVHAAPYVQKTLVAAPVVQKTLIAQPTLVKQVDDYDHNPQYTYSYDIQDGLTGDSKSQHETRDGDVVKGQYSLIDADGHKRTVDYTSDPVHGFNAVVHREPLGHAIKVAAAPTVIKTIAAPTVVKTIAAPTVVKTVAAPVTYAHAPVAYAHAPVVHHAAPVVHAAPAYYHH